MSGYDEMVFRTMTRDNAYFYDVVGLESEGTTSDFQIGQNSYLYGTRFMLYNALTHSPEQVIEWVNRKPGTAASFSKQYQKTFGKSLDEAWSDWIEWEHRWQEGESQTYTAVPDYSNTPRLPTALWARYRGRFFDAKQQKLFTAVNYPGEFAYVAGVDVNTGEIENVCGIQTPSALLRVPLPHTMRIPRPSFLPPTTENTGAT